MRFVAIVLSALASLAAYAHPLAPALLELRETAPGQYDVLWRTSATRAQRIDVAPRLPRECHPTSGVAQALEAGEALVERWTVDCGPHGLAGRSVRVEGIEASRINAIVRIQERSGRWVQGLLDASAPQLSVPRAEAVQAVFPSFLRLGMEHLLTGYDHLLFLLALVVVVAGVRRLAFTVTAFTLGHSITLGLAVLGYVRFDPAWAELGIAVTLVVLGLEAVREQPGRAARHPGLLAGAFGLVHGLGFAGALSEVGLPAGDVPLALLGFNLGIELGQLAVVAALAAGLQLARRQVDPAYMRLRRVPGYIVGTLGAYWCYQRAAAVMIGTWAGMTST